MTKGRATAGRAARRAGIMHRCLSHAHAHCAGIPGVVNSGKATANLIIADMKVALPSAALKPTEVSYA